MYFGIWPSLAHLQCRFGLCIIYNHRSSAREEIVNEYLKIVIYE